jgi:hypothetical protein
VDEKTKKTNPAEKPPTEQNELTDDQLDGVAGGALDAHLTTFKTVSGHDVTGGTSGSGTP